MLLVNAYGVLGNWRGDGERKREREQRTEERKREEGRSKG